MNRHILSAGKQLNTELCRILVPTLDRQRGAPARVRPARVAIGPTSKPVPMNLCPGRTPVERAACRKGSFETAAASER